MDVVEGPAELVHEELDEDERHELLVLGEVPGEAVHRVRHVLEHQVQVKLLRLLAVGVEAVLHVDDVAVGQETHDLELAVLVPLVLQHLLDGHHLARLHHLGEKHDAEGAMADHALRAVGDGLGHSTRAGLRDLCGEREWRGTVVWRMAWCVCVCVQTYRRIRRLHRQVLGSRVLRHSKDSAQVQTQGCSLQTRWGECCSPCLRGAGKGGRGDGEPQGSRPSCAVCGPVVLPGWGGGGGWFLRRVLSMSVCV